MAPDAVDMEGLSKLTEFGLLGTLLFIALCAVIWLYGRQNSLWGERLSDWKASQEIQQAQTTKISELSATSEQRTRAQEEAARALQLMAQANTQQAAEITRLREEIGEVKTEISLIKDVRQDILHFKNEVQKLIVICGRLEHK